MPEWLYQSLGFTNLIPAVIGVFVYKQCSTEYHPFFYLIWLGAFNDTLCFFVYKFYGISSTPFNSIYILFDFLLIIWLFSRWRRQAGKIFIIFLATGIMLWVADNIILHTIFRVNTVFRVIYSFIIVYLSIDELNSIVFTERNEVTTHPRFIISLGFLIFYSYKAILETFYVIEVRFSNQFYTNLFYILAVINGVTNLVYTYGMLCFLKNKKYTYSY